MASHQNRSVTRRGVLQGTAVLAAAAALPIGTAAGAEADAGSAELAAAALAGSFTADDAQRFVRIIPGGNGVIYAIDSVGKLFYYRQTGWTNCTNAWSPGTGVQIGNGFNKFQTVLVDADGQFFCITTDGTMYWNRFVVSDPATGAGSFVSSNGIQIGTGFTYAKYPRIFGGWDGVIFAQDSAGDLYYFRYMTANDQGTGTWLNNGNPRSTGGTGFQGYFRICAGADGVIYGARCGAVTVGTLEWLRYDIYTGKWDNNGTPVKMPTANDFVDVSIKGMFCDNNGVIYTVAVDEPSGSITNDSSLQSYRLKNYANVTPASGGLWRSASPSTVGNGFSYEPTGALQGYATALTMPSGASNQVAVSHGFSNVAVTYEVVKVAGAGTGGTMTSVTNLIPLTVCNGIQALPNDYRSEGCNWSPENATSSSTWRINSSGLYAFRLHGPTSMHYDIPFVVTPAANATKAPFAVMLPYNTYNAYNSWGGHDKYNATTQWTSTFMRPSNVVNIDSIGHISHTLYSDLFLLQWMDRQGFAYDLYIDGDLDVGNLNLSDYKALVIGSHPEYWTAQMRTDLIAYLGNGGKLIYTGGNGIYEYMTYTSDGNGATYLTAGGQRWYIGAAKGAQSGSNDSNPTYPDAATLNVSDTGGCSDPQAYGVLAPQHFLFANTTVQAGTSFGGTAYNTAANGWEVDSREEPDSSTFVVLASGANGETGGDMTFWEQPSGGWIFTAGSINFNSALPYDPTISQLLTNTFNYALG